jgi:hypothetical protein
MSAIGGCAFDWGFPSSDAPDGAGDTDHEPGPPPLSDAFKEAEITETSPPPTECKTSTECGPGRYCHFADHLCGGSIGKCEAPVVGCMGVMACGCDGTVYKDACVASLAGVDVGTTAACATPAGMFRCGTLYCTDKSTFCVMSNKGTEFRCEAFEAACLPGTCSCTAVTKLACPTCDDTVVNQVKVKCN